MRPPVSSIRSVLAGFTGLLALMGFLALDSARQIRNVSAASAVLRKESNHRDSVLDQLRTDTYRSATLVRDYMLEQDETIASSQKEELLSLRSRIEQALTDLANHIPKEEIAAIEALHQHTESYWNSLAPTLDWDQSLRRERGEAFLRNTIIPRRDEMVQFVRQVNALDERTLEASDDRIQAVQAEFQRRVQLLSILALVLGSILAIIVVRHTQRLGAEAANRFDEAVAAREDLKRLSDRLVTVQEEERRSLSRELHDDLGQSMSAILLEVRNLQSVGEDLALQSRTASIRHLAEESVAKVRNMALLLRPGMLDELGLVPALRWHGREVARRTGLRVKMIADELTDDLPDSHRTAIYRVVQEALNNCVKHSRASEVRVLLHREADGLSVSVQDDGIGFNPVHNKGLGLLGMTERVSRIGGRFHIESQPGRGTIVSTYFPLAQNSCTPDKESAA